MNLAEILSKIISEYEPLEGADVECGTITKETLEEAREALNAYLQGLSKSFTL